MHRDEPGDMKQDRWGRWLLNLPGWRLVSPYLPRQTIAFVGAAAELESGQ